MSLKRYWYCFQSMNVDLRNMFNILTISAISRFACQKEKRKKVCSNIMFCWLLAVGCIERKKRRWTKWNCYFKCKMNITTLTYGSIHIMVLSSRGEYTFDSFKFACFFVCVTIIHVGLYFVSLLFNLSCAVEFCVLLSRNVQIALFFLLLRFFLYFMYSY